MSYYACFDWMKAKTLAMQKENCFGISKTNKKNISSLCPLPHGKTSEVLDNLKTLWKHPFGTPGTCVRINLNCYMVPLVSPEPFLVLIEYVPYGDLLGYLRKSRGLNDTYYKDPDIKPQTSLTSQQLMKFAWQIADGMSYLSSKSVSGSFCHQAIHSQQAPDR